MDSSKARDVALRHHERLAVFERDSYTCRYCANYWYDKQTGERLANYYSPSPFTRRLWKPLLHVDHVVPLCKGGTDDIDNLVTACCSCNLTKARNVWEPIPLPWAT